MPVIDRPLAILLCLAACGGPMTTKQETATVIVAGRRVTVTAADGETMRRALVESLSASPDPALRDEAERLQHAIPTIADGQLRIGPWVFDGRERSAVLAWDQHDTPAATVYQVAHLEGSAGGTWRIISVSEEIHHLEH